jgi:hypothetical protein
VDEIRVTIVGCGPAGLAAAHAAVGLGAEVTIYGPGVKSPQNGPLLIQRPIPGINNGHPDGTIHQIVIGGSILDYRYKLYGDVNIGINGDVLQKEYHAWDHRETYDKLWDLYNSLIHEAHISGIGLFRMHNYADLVVSTADASRMCVTKGVHRFLFKEVAITPECSYPGQPDNTIVFNGGHEYQWVRSSRVFGVPVTEWNIDDAPPGARIIRKPIGTDCNCYPHVLRTGRFGAYKNEVWVDTAYNDTRAALVSMMRKDELEAIK